MDPRRSRVVEKRAFLRTQGIRITCEFSGQPQEWFLKIIVTLCTDIIVPKVLFSVESDSFSLIQDQQKKYKTFS